MWILTLAFHLLGSGSHSPFLIHVDDLGPMSTSSDGQEKLTLLPSSAGLV